MQGVTLVDQHRLADALLEFERCYAIYPAYGTLYNIAQVRAALGQPVAAIEAFEKYLTDGGAAIPAKQRARAEAELAAQRALVGEITVQVTPPNAAVRIDDRALEPSDTTFQQRVTPGHHQLLVELAGYRSALRDVEVAAQAHVEVTLTLQPLPVAPPPVSRVTAADTARSAPAEPPTNSQRTQKTAAYLVGGTGVVGMGVGMGLAIAGQAKHRQALDQWVAGEKDTARHTESASSHEKTAGYVVLGVGAAATVAGGILFFTASSATAPAAPARAAGQLGFSCSPWFSSSLLGASLQGWW